MFAACAANKMPLLRYAEIIIKWAINNLTCFQIAMFMFKLTKINQIPGYAPVDCAFNQVLSVAESFAWGG